MASKSKSKPAKTTPARPRVLLYRLGDIPAVRQVIPFFDLPPAYLDLAFYLLDQQHRDRMTLFDALPEPKVPKDLVKRAEALNEAIADLVTDGEGAPLEADELTIGYHAGATYAQVEERLTADGFAVVNAVDVVRAALKPRDADPSRARLARAERAMGREADRCAQDSLVVDEAIETWSDVEEQAFHRLAEARALGGLVPTKDQEPACVDRWGLFAERLARAGWSAEDVEDAWLDGLAGDRHWPSAKWFAMALLPRLDGIARRVLARSSRIDPARALTRLLVEPIEELPYALDALYRVGVHGLLAESDVGSALDASDWERLVALDEKRFARLAKKARPALPPSPPAPAPSAPRLAEVKARWGVDFPEEVLAIWDLASSLSPEDPRDAFAADDLLGITLVGPFDVLAGETRVKKALDLRLHWRYRQDPPEFFTVAAGNEDGLHFGYWFDDPARGAACVAAYYANDAYEIEVPGRTLGEALRRWLERAHAGAIENLRDDRKHEASYDRSLGRLARLRERLQSVATRERLEIGEAYLARYDLGALRRRTALVATPERMGVVAPADRYRPLSLAGTDLTKALAAPRRRKAIVKEALGLAAQGFPVAALALGRACWGRRLDDEAYALLDAAYAGLDRPVLREVLALHRQHRDLESVDVLDR